MGLTILIVIFPVSVTDALECYLCKMKKKRVFEKHCQADLSPDVLTAHHTWHLCLGFISELTGQFQVFPNSGELERVPMTRT